MKKCPSPDRSGILAGFRLENQQDIAQSRIKLLILLKITEVMLVFDFQNRLVN